MWHCCTQTNHNFRLEISTCYCIVWTLWLTRHPRAYPISTVFKLQPVQWMEIEFFFCKLSTIHIFRLHCIKSTIMMHDTVRFQYDIIQWYYSTQQQIQNVITGLYCFKRGITWYWFSIMKCLLAICNYLPGIWVVFLKWLLMGLVCATLIY